MRAGQPSRAGRGIPSRRAADRIVIQTEGNCMEIERILAPIDFSYRSRNELQWAISLAMRFRAELISLHVVPPEVVKNALEWKNETWEGMRADYSSQACRLVEEIEAEAPALGLDHSEVVVAGKPVEEILDAIRKLDIDLIVM